MTVTEIEPHCPAPGGKLKRLQRETETARRFASGARTGNTQRAYRADWRCFTSWCEARGLQALPAAPETVALYVASRAEGDEDAPPLKVSLLSRRLSAISQAHKAAGYPSLPGGAKSRSTASGPASYGRSRSQRKR